ncbi:MAG: FHA domain-containing protein [Gemmatimonadales bacterium]
MPDRRLVSVTRRLVRLLVVFPAILGAQQSQQSATTGAQRDQEKASLFRFCQQMDQAATGTLQSIRDRTDCWKRMQLEGMGDSAVDAGYRAAVADYDAAIKSDSARLAGEAVDQQLIAVQRDIQTRDLATARRVVDQILAAQPDNQRALAFHDRIVALAKARRVRVVLFGVAGAVLLIALLLGVGSRLLASRHHRQLVRRRADASHQKAVLEIVDGIGRGKIYAIDGPIFRIGSAASNRPEEKNDLILSDADAFISRYHCAIVHKDGKYFLIDSSLNGTYMDEELLERGEHRELEDGAEFSLAGMVRVKFLVM